jgi:hypothetical protein
MSGQDTTACVICGCLLTRRPKLGEWIAHDQCREAVIARVTEAEQRATRVEHERWTTAARKHAGTWLMFGTPDGNVIASDYLMWAATMQPVSEDGTRPFALEALGGPSIG